MQTPPTPAAAPPAMTLGHPAIAAPHERLGRALAAAENGDGVVALRENPVPLVIRILVGAWLAWMTFIVGAMFEVFDLMPSPNDPPPSAARIAGVALFASFWLYALCGWRKRVTLDLRRRTFHFRSGLPPFTRARGGSLDPADGAQGAGAGAARLEQRWLIGRSSGPSGGGTYTYAYLLLHLPGADDATGAPPPALILAGGPSAQITARDVGASREVAARLAAALGQSLDDAGSLAERPPDPKTPETPAWVGYAVAAVFGGFFLLIAGSLAYNAYQGRGPRHTFPRGGGPASPVALNQRVGDCVVRTMLVTSRDGRIETSSGGERPSTYYIATYRIALDVENPTAKPARADFVVGFSGATREEVHTGPIPPGARREVAVEFRTSEGPKSVFLRPLKPAD